jgi:hypothetical protein
MIRDRHKYAFNPPKIRFHPWYRNVFFFTYHHQAFVRLSLGSPRKNRPAANRVAVAPPSCAQRSLPGVPRPGRRRHCVPLRGRHRSVPLRRQGSLGESRPRDMTFETSAIRSCRLLPTGIHRVMGEGAVGQRAEHQQRGHHWGSASTGCIYREK